MFEPRPTVRARLAGFLVAALGSAILWLLLLGALVLVLPMKANAQVVGGCVEFVDRAIYSRLKRSPGPGDLVAFELAFDVPDGCEVVAVSLIFTDRRQRSHRVQLRDTGPYPPGAYSVLAPIDLPADLRGLVTVKLVLRTVDDRVIDAPHEERIAIVEDDNS